MEKIEQAACVFALVMGLLLMREGFSYLSQTDAAEGHSDDRIAIVLAGPNGAQKSAQADFLKRRYGLRTIDASDLTREVSLRRNRRVLVPDCPSGLDGAACLATLVHRKDLPHPVFIQIADRRWHAPGWAVEAIQEYYPDADIWTVDGTRPSADVSETLQHLLDAEARVQNPR